MDLGLAPVGAALLAGGVVAGWWLLRARKPAAADRPENHGGSAAEVLGASETLVESEALGARMLELEQRVVALEEALDRLRERSDRGALADHREQVYAQAIRMVSRGAAIEDLVSLCGLSRNEAELIAMMHGVAAAPED